MAGVRHTFSGTSAIGMVLARLQQLDKTGFVEARREIGEYLVNDIRDNLDGQVLFDGRPMYPSKASRGGTFRRRIRTGKRKGKLRSVVVQPRKTLLHKGHLRDSYTYNLTASGIEIGSNLVYARIHHEGGRAGKGHRVVLPARPLLGLGPRQAGRIGALLLADVRRIAEGSKL